MGRLPVLHRDGGGRDLSPAETGGTVLEWAAVLECAGLRPRRRRLGLANLAMPLARYGPATSGQTFVTPEVEHEHQWQQHEKDRDHDLPTLHGLLRGRPGHGSSAAMKPPHGIDPCMHHRDEPDPQLFALPPSRVQVASEAGARSAGSSSFQSVSTPTCSNQPARTSSAYRYVMPGS